MDLEIIDNYLPSYYFERIKNTILEDSMFSWKWQDGVTSDHEPNYFQFVHSFYDYEYENSKSYYLDILQIMESRLGVKHWRSIKANLNPRTIFKRFHGWHADYPAPQYKPGKTAILYLNTNNGCTRFKKGGKVKCVENRLAIFDAYSIHSGVTCTNQKRKVVVNFNYE